MIEVCLAFWAQRVNDKERVGCCQFDLRIQWQDKPSCYLLCLWCFGGDGWRRWSRICSYGWEVWLDFNGRYFNQLRIYLESFACGYAGQKCWALICLNWEGQEVGCFGRWNIWSSTIQRGAVPALQWVAGSGRDTLHRRSFWCEEFLKRGGKHSISRSRGGTCF